MKYSNAWLTDMERQNKNLGFIFFSGQESGKDGEISKNCLNQWWPANFQADGIIYPTAEHWMMASKARLFQDENTMKLILASTTPAEAKKCGRLVAGFNPAIWDKHKYSLVVEGNLHKFSGNDSLKRFLVGTDDCILVEASPDDSVWGIGLAADDQRIHNPLNWKGENLLGYALMEVRDRLK